MTQFAADSGEPIPAGGAPGEFPPDAYVVRQGGYGAVRGLVTLVVAAIAGYCLADPKPAVRPDIGYLIAAALVVFSLVRFRKAISRPIVLAVHSGGVYFGPELAAAVARFAPGVPVIAGQNEPPPLG